jgi:pilus assembly protein Flp/PilA
MTYSLLRHARRLAADRRGATAIEYGLILSLVVLGAFAAIDGLASKTIGLWNHVDGRVAEVT